MAGRATRSRSAAAMDALTNASNSDNDTGDKPPSEESDNGKDPGEDDTNDKHNQEDDDTALDQAVDEFCQALSSQTAVAREAWRNVIRAWSTRWTRAVQRRGGDAPDNSTGLFAPFAVWALDHLDTSVVQIAVRNEWKIGVGDAAFYSRIPPRAVSPMRDIATFIPTDSQADAPELALLLFGDQIFSSVKLCQDIRS